MIGSYPIADPDTGEEVRVDALIERLRAERDDAREKLRMSDYWLANTVEERHQAKHQVRILVALAQTLWLAAAGATPHVAHSLAAEFPWLKEGE